MIAPDLPGFGGSAPVEPPSFSERIDPRLWEEDWRIMSLPGRLEMHRALALDYRSHFARFGEIASYLERWQPPILDGPHFLLETHPAECAALMSAFVKRLGSGGSRTS